MLTVSLSAYTRYELTGMARQWNERLRRAGVVSERTSDIISILMDQSDELFEGKLIELFGDYVNFVE